MKDKKNIFVLALLFSLGSFTFSTPLESPSWAFRLDLPEGYEFLDGDGKDQFSFENPEGARFDLRIFHGTQAGKAAYASVEELTRDIQSQLNNSGETDPFEYDGKKACLIELEFQLPGAGPMSGWALCMELNQSSQSSPGSSQAPGPKPLLLAMAYGPAGKNGLLALHLSALDSLAPEEGDRLKPGPLTEYAWPREKRVKTPVFGLDLEALVFEEEAEAAQALVDREFQVLRLYENAPNWKEAWIRFYRAIYRDSFDRLINIAFQVERKLNVPSRENRDFAEQVLKWVQSFEYERDQMGSDFLNAVTAATEGRGDCDSRAMLWAVILNQANIPAAMMVSRQYSHAMGLAELPGSGAHFEVEGQRLLVAETTADVSIGLIGETVSEIENWLGILFRQ